MLLTNSKRRNNLNLALITRLVPTRPVSSIVFELVADLKLSSVVLGKAIDELLILDKQLLMLNYKKQK